VHSRYPKAKYCDNALPIKFTTADGVQMDKFKYAVDVVCSISLTFRTGFAHVTPYTLETLKIKVKVIA